jgi:hypothetical protein
MIGLLTEVYFFIPIVDGCRFIILQNGPIKAIGSFPTGQNNFSWNQLADTIWVDQPGEYIPTSAYFLPK